MLFAVFAVRVAVSPWHMLMGPAGVILGFGVGLDVTEMLLEVAEFPQLLVTTKVYEPVTVALYEALVAPVMFNPFFFH
jgi:hypothetical protein